MTIVDSGTVKFCTECRMKFDPEVSGSATVCPNCAVQKSKPKKVEGKGK